MMREREVPRIVAAGLEDEPRTVPEWASAMSAEWRAALARFPRAVPGSMAGLPPDRAARLVDGGVIPKASEAAALDGALGCNAARHLPARRPYVQKAFGGPRAGRALVKRHALTQSRQSRVDGWADRVAASGLSLAAIAEASGIGVGRCTRVLRQGAIASADEVQRLVSVLGEPS